MLTHTWTAHEIARAKAMRATGYSFSAIDRALGRYIGSTRHKLIEDHAAKATIPRAAKDHRVGPFRAPDDVLAERDRRRAAADARDFTATFCGDPPPGYSALDQKWRTA